LLIRLLQFQISILCEYNRAIKGAGNFKLKYEMREEAAPLAIDCKLDMKSAAQIIEKIKSISIPVGENRAEGQRALAKDCEKEWNDRMNVYNVKGPLSSRTELVQFEKNKFVCTCTQKRECFHIIAVRE